MAFTAVQNVVTVAFDSSITVNIAATGLNNLIIVNIYIPNVTATVTSIADSANPYGNSYTLGSPLDNAARLYQAYGIQTVSGITSITVVFSATDTYRVSVNEFSATGKISYDKRSTGSSSTGTAVSVTTFSPVVSDELIISTGYFSVYYGTWTAGSGYTKYTNDNTLVSQYRLAGTTSETSPATLSGNGYWSEIAQAFREISIKTVEGLAIASVKTKNGLAIASIKTINGLQ